MERTQEWKSPRRLAEEAQACIRRRFEEYMQMEERGELPRDVALDALRDEVSFADAEVGLGSETAA